MFVVGDYRQCFIPETPVKTPDGYTQIKDIKKSDEIIVSSGRGDSHTAKVSEVIKRDYSGRIIVQTNKRGLIINATPENTRFIIPIIHEMKYFVYLMYKRDSGIRIRVTSKHKVK